MEQGAVEQTIIEQCMRLNQPLPDAMQKAPDIPLGLELYYMAFIDLNTCRVDPLMRIPWTALSMYCDSLGLDDEEREDLFYFIQELDQALIDFNRKKMEKKSPIRKGAQSGGGHKDTPRRPRR